LAVHSAKAGVIAVLGTEATIASCAFERAIHKHAPSVRVVQQSCPLFVPVIEEGRLEDDRIARLAIDDYLAPVRRLQPDVVLLGCTHYPLLESALRDYFGKEVELIDSGQAVAQDVAEMLQQSDMLSRTKRHGTVQCYVSDFPQRFSTIGSQFLGEPLPHVIQASASEWHSLLQATDHAATA